MVLLLEVEDITNKFETTIIVVKARLVVTRSISRAPLIAELCVEGVNILP